MRDLIDAIEEDVRPLNVARFHGPEAKLADVLDAARTLPFGAARRLVLVLQVEKLQEVKRDSEASDRALAVLQEYLAAPSLTTTLALVVEEALDVRTKLARMLDRHATVVACVGVEHASEALAWVRGEIGRRRKRLGDAAVKLIVERGGTDVTRLRKEVDRVLLYVGDAPAVSLDDVKAVVGAAVSQDIWAVTNAIERGQVTVALKELALALEAGAAPYAVLGQLAWVARSKLPPGRAKDAVEALFRTDLDLKSSAGDPRILLERLVVELCGPPAVKRSR